MTIRLHVGGALVLAAGLESALPPSATRHLQVRRAQPGDPVQLFDGAGHEHAATVVAMSRQQAHVRVGEALTARAELPRRVTLAVGVPANERMDALVEKATELGVAGIQPLLCERSVVRLEGERAERRRAHWQAVAVAACEQSGRATVPQVAPIQNLIAWLSHPLPQDTCRLLLSTRPDAPLLAAFWTRSTRCAGALGLATLSGPEGGLTPAEEALAAAAGFEPVSLGARILRADTAPLAVMAWAALQT